MQPTVAHFQHTLDLCAQASGNGASAQPSGEMTELFCNGIKTARSAIWFYSSTINSALMQNSLKQVQVSA